jgi:hypothetical protein
MTEQALARQVLGFSSVNSDLAHLVYPQLPAHDRRFEGFATARATAGRTSRSSQRCPLEDSTDRFDNHLRIVVLHEVTTTTCDDVRRVVRQRCKIRLQLEPQ